MQFIILEIDNPNESNFLAKLWHWYYVHFLNDQGGNFLTFKKFKEVLDKNIDNKKITTGIINTIKGRYFYASLLETIKNEADRYGIPVISSEIVGLTPLEALIDVSKHYLRLEKFTADQVLEKRLLELQK